MILQLMKFKYNAHIPNYVYVHVVDFLKMIWSQSLCWIFQSPDGTSGNENEIGFLRINPNYTKF